ncbi:MAG: glycerol-3-phosphate 1-O-acyltransferase PlsY [bacterium]
MRVRVREGSEQIMDALGLIAALLMAYLIGSIPFGVILARIYKLPDPRYFGSGNIGATNMLRSGRKDVAAATLVLDGLKGIAAVLVVEAIDPNAGALGLAAAVVGHSFPLWLNFKGGKGVATMMGGLLAFSFTVGAATALIWIGMFYYKRISSLAALVAFSFAPFIALLLENGISALVILLTVLLIVYNHQFNLRRLAKGTEPKFEWGKKKE